MTEPELDEHEYEDRLEPRHLIRRSHVVLRAGTLMLGAGTSSLRVREVMTAVARTVGIEHLHAQVTFATIVLTVGRRGIFRTQVAETRASVNADRIAMLQRFAHDLPARATVAEVEAGLDVIERTPRRYPGWMLVPLVALACASIAVLSNGGVREVLAVLPASALAYALHRWLTRLQVNHLAVVVTSVGRRLRAVRGGGRADHDPRGLAEPAAGRWLHLCVDLPDPRVPPCHSGPGPDPAGPRHRAAAPHVRGDGRAGDRDRCLAGGRGRRRLAGSRRRPHRPPGAGLDRLDRGQLLRGLRVGDDVQRRRHVRRWCRAWCPSWATCRGCSCCSSG